MANAFGDNFDQSTNAFGINFTAHCNAFGLNGFTAPAPSPILDPLIADYDFNYYTLFSSTIDNQQTTTGIGAATVNEPLNNTYVADPVNSYLFIYAPDNFPNPTGGILTPVITNTFAIEMWVEYQDNGPYGQYFLDYRLGVDNGYWITSPSAPDAIGPGQQGAEVFANTTSLGISTDTAPAIGQFLAGKGWYQIFINYPSAVADDMAFFMRFNGTQGMPISVGQICIYDRNLTQAEITTIYNNKCSRYLLPPV